MTKAERLIYLVNMIKNRGTALVSEMASECEVTQRTIYRDINSLMKLNFPLYYKNGYRLVLDVGFPFAGFNVEDIELICYSLLNNPLSGHPFFKRRFRIIEQNIQARFHKQMEVGQGSLFLFEKKRDSIEKSRESDIISGFLKAVQERRKISITSVDSSTGRRICIPLVIRLRQSDPSLIVATETKLVVEEPIRSIEYLRLTDEKFTQRPLHLLQRGLALQKKVDET
jgi:predicted DNA-binding transcriptional regulator YafY